MRLWFRVPDTKQAPDKLHVRWREIRCRLLLSANLYELPEGFCCSTTKTNSQVIIGHVCINSYRQTNRSVISQHMFPFTVWALVNCIRRYACHYSNLKAGVSARTTSTSTLKKTAHNRTQYCYCSPKPKP